MNVAEAAQRLGVARADVTEVREHHDGHLVVLAPRAVVITRTGAQYPYRGDAAAEGDEESTAIEEAADPKPTGSKSKRARGAK